MEFLSVLALVLLTLLGYSAGAVLGAKNRKVVPEFVDLVLVLALWCLALATRGPLGKWLAIGVWLAVALGVGAAGSALRRGHFPTEKAEVISASIQGPRRSWARWRAFSRRMGNYQSRIWLSFFYFVVVLPFGLAVRIFSDPLRTKTRDAGSAWVARQETTADLESGRNQF